MAAGRYLAVAGILLLLALAGCGGSDEGATAGTAATLSKAEFLKKANAICERGTDRIDAAYGRAGEHVPKGAENEDFMNEAAARIVIPVRREELRKIRALGLPAGNEETIEAFLVALKEGIERGERNHPSLRASGGASYAFEKAYKIANKHELSSCFLG
ncbi:MAG TPA: hypothetical protein VGW80_08410 [Solirubrobacterales bacterium]|jgi:hypothetical protein|nr:hypothetical protein [Solirubrobacterales bacterium]